MASFPIGPFRAEALLRQAFHQDSFADSEQQPEEHAEIRRSEQLDQLIQGAIVDHHQSVFEKQIDVRLQQEKEVDRRQAEQQEKQPEQDEREPVSYTHLTLPTKR